MPEDYYPKHFPNLAKNFRRTSEPAYYNCIAYVVGDLNRKWWPGEYHPDWALLDYWPEEAPNEETIEAFTVALATAGYARCWDGCHNPKFEKVALYALEDGTVTHAALQQEDGTWRSKLGGDEDIEHSLDGLVGPFYGSVVAYFSRRRANYHKRLELKASVVRLICHVRELVKSLLLSSARRRPG